MVVRVSNPLFLEILTASPVVGVPLEFDVYDGANPATMLATLENAFDRGFTDHLADLGSGRFKLRTDDPKATPEIIRKGNLVRVKVAGIYRFAFWMDDPTVVVLSTGEHAGQVYSVTGRGGLTYLDRAITYPPGWPAPTATSVDFIDVRAAEALRALLDAATARGTLPAITYDSWDDTLDSHGEAWDDLLSISIPARTSVLDVATQFMGLGLELNMTPELRLEAFVNYARHFEDDVVFRAGYHIVGDVSKEVRGHAERTRMLVEGSGGGFVEVLAPGGLEGDPYIGRREGGLQFSNSNDPTTLQRAGESALEQLNADTDAISLRVHHSLTEPGQFEPWRDYRKGDWVGLHVPPFYDRAAYRVMALTIEEVDGGDFAVTLDLNSVALEAVSRLKRAVDALAGGSSGATVSGNLGNLGGGGQSSGAALARHVSDPDPHPVYATDSDVAAALAALGLDDLLDVDTTGPDAPSDGDALVWDAGRGLWVPAAAAGGGGLSLPQVPQVKCAGTAVSAITLDSAPPAGHSVILVVDAFNVADPTAVTSTNTTWTKVKSVSAGAKYSVWVGVVAGGPGGTLITITHANGFLSCFALEVVDTLTGTIGVSASGAANAATRTSTPPTAGSLVLVCGGTDNTGNSNTGFATLPVVGFMGGVVWAAVGYAMGDNVYAIMNVSAGTIIIAELT